MSFTLTPPKPKRVSRKSRLEENFAAELKLYGLPEPIREYAFHPTRKWRFDFCWIDQKIAVEIHGGLFLPKGGAHTFGATIEQDFEKENEAVRLGWKVYKFGPKALYRKQKTNESSQALAFMYEVFHGNRANALPGL